MHFTIFYGAIECFTCTLSFFGPIFEFFIWLPRHKKKLPRTAVEGTTLKKSGTVFFFNLPYILFAQLSNKFVRFLYIDHSSFCTLIWHVLFALKFLLELQSCSFPCISPMCTKSFFLELTLNSTYKKGRQRDGPVGTWNHIKSELWVMNSQKIKMYRVLNR